VLWVRVMSIAGSGENAYGFCVGKGLVCMTFWEVQNPYLLDHPESC